MASGRVFLRRRIRCSINVYAAVQSAFDAYALKDAAPQRNATQRNAPRRIRRERSVMVAFSVSGEFRNYGNLREVGLSLSQRRFILHLIFVRMGHSGD